MPTLKQRLAILEKQQQAVQNAVSPELLGTLVFSDSTSARISAPLEHCGIRTAILFGSSENISRSPYSGAERHAVELRLTECGTSNKLLCIAEQLLRHGESSLE